MTIWLEREDASLSIKYINHNIFTFFFYKKNVKHLSVQQSLLKYENCTWYTLDHIDLLITCITKLHNNKQEYTCICDVLLIMLKRNMIIIAHIHQSFHKTTHFA